MRVEASVETASCGEKAVSSALSTASQTLASTPASNAPGQRRNRRRNQWSKVMSSSVAANQPVSAVQAVRAGRFPRIFRRVVRAYQVGRARAALSALSDATLKDIGVSRSEIDFVAERMVDGDRDTLRMPPSMWVRG
jgi:uncharacterized protein YjiS (DUF1127 family)